MTDEILSGNSVEGLTIKELLKVKHFGDALDGVISIMEEDNICFDKRLLCEIHSVLAKDEVSDCDRFRTQNVFLNGIENYIPPSGEKLDDIWNEGMGIIKEIENPLERAVVSFLFLSRVQYFEDANKRTASLFMNAILVDAGLKPLLFPQSDTQRFMEKLADFYKTGNADEIMEVMVGYARPK